MSQQSAQERTERATPKRLKDARSKGQVARSREFNTSGVMLASAAALLMLGERLVARLAELARDALIHERADIFETGYAVVAFAAAGRGALEAVAPFLAVTLVAALVAPLAIGGWAFSLKAIAPKLEKLSPLKGLKRVFGARGLMELAKSLAKFAFVGAVAVVLLEGLADDFLALSHQPVMAALRNAVSLIAWSLLILSAPLIVIAAIDVPFQLFQHAKQLRMTRQELRDEHKETDGNPEVKSRIRAVQQEMSRQRMMQDVPKADVVITNPTHYAVALSYDDSTMRAPKVVAKGADLVAGQIRQVARLNGVPLFSAPPLARALFANTRLGDEVPADLYTSVAQVLAYVYQLRDGAAGAVPPSPPDVDVPPGFDPKDAER